MKQPELSPYMMARKPSGIRLGQIKFLERKNPPILVNGSIGNVMRPMHPAMQLGCLIWAVSIARSIMGLCHMYQLRALMSVEKHSSTFCAAKALIQQGLMYS